MLEVMAQICPVHKAEERPVVLIWIVAKQSHDSLRENLRFDCWILVGDRKLDEPR